MKNYGYYKIEDFVLYIESIDNKITLVKVVDECLEENLSDMIIKFKVELDEYFARKRNSFSVEYCLDQLPFRKRLYMLITDIEYGSKSSVNSLLEAIGLSKGRSVIIRALYDNPLLLIVPCHRVINPLRRLQAHKYSKAFKEFLLEVERGE